MKQKIIAQGAEKSKICTPGSSKIIAQGAEAKILLNRNTITKDRIKKSYRIPELDNAIRKKRTRSEIKLLEKASKVINVPLPLTINKKNPSFQIHIPFIDGKKLSDHLDKLKNKFLICKQIGKDIAKLHDNSIIHGDLTTSNMILVNNKEKISNKKSVNNKTYKRISTLTTSHQSTNKVRSKPIIFFIDFGLGYISHKLEDKAVDLHLLKQALEAKHYKHYKALWKAVESGYKTNSESKKVLERLTAVEKRGRYKH